MIVAPKTRQIFFKTYAVLALMIAIYHFWGIFYKFGETPVWRHILFVFINLFCVYGVLKRPNYFFYFFCILCIQQYYSHGHYFIKLWAEKREIHWISVFEFFLLPIALICFIEDFKEKNYHKN